MACNPCWLLPVNNHSSRFQSPLAPITASGYTIHFAAQPRGNEPLTLASSWLDAGVSLSSELAAGVSCSSPSHDTIPICLSHIKLCLWKIKINKDIGMVSCGFVHIWCVMTPCFFLFSASSHPYIPLCDFSTCFHYCLNSLWQHCIFSLMFMCML